MPLPAVHQMGGFRAFFTPGRTAAAVCLALVFMVLGVFWQCRAFSFVNWDDNAFVYENSHVRQGLTWENVRWSLTAGIGKEVCETDYWRPVSIMSHMLDVSLFGLNAGAHHMMSVALHALTAVALFLVMRAMTGRLWPSAFVAAVFAIHPLHVESVAWVGERKDVLSGLFFVLALGAYQRFVQRPFHLGIYLLLLLMSALSMMSKPMLVTLPCVLLLLDHWPLGRTRSVPLKRLFIEKIPLFLMTATVAGITLTGRGCPNDPLWAALPWYYRAGNAMLSYGTYIRQTFWPEGLVVFYTFPGRNLNVGGAWASVALLIIVTALAWRLRQKSWLGIGWLWFLGMLMPVIGLLTQAGDQAHADRYTYLSMIGLTLMVTWAADEWAGTQKARRQFLGATAAAVLVVLSFAAHAQTSHWRDTLSLWQHAVNCDPTESVAHANLGNALIEAGRTEEAIVSYERALKVNAFHLRARMNLGLTLMRVGKFEEAEAHLRRAVQDGSQEAEAFSGLALILLRKGVLDEAITYLQKAVALHPDVSNCFNLGNALMQSGQYARAAESFLQVIEFNPNHADARYCLGMACTQLGNVTEAGACYESALRVNPSHLPSLNNLAWLLATSKQDSLRNGARAVVLMEHALQLPGGSRAHLLQVLAAAYAESGQFEKASQTAFEAATNAQNQRNPALAQAILKERQAYLSGVPWRE
ncbi:tetratricopeptide repeat protein [Prosthecobacter sp.]|uniref:tetratricopeptide repeat protein n=1 Tax=Prosthecobacter sp. TaxID=1965333 RepID=UPI003784CA6F